MSFVKLIIDITDSDYSVKVKYDSTENMRHYKVCCPMSELSRLDRNTVNNYLPVELRMVSNTSVKIEIRSFCTAEMVEIYNQLVRNFEPQTGDRYYHMGGATFVSTGTISHSGTRNDINAVGTRDGATFVSTGTISHSGTNPFTIRPDFAKSTESNTSLFTNTTPQKTSSLAFTKLSPQAITVLDEVKAYAICHGKHPDFTLTTEKNKLKIRNYISSVYGKPISYEVVDEVMEALRQHYLWK